MSCHFSHAAALQRLSLARNSDAPTCLLDLGGQGFYHLSHIVWPLHPSFFVFYLNNIPWGIGLLVVVGIGEPPCSRIGSGAGEGIQGRHNGWEEDFQHQQHLPELYKIFKDTCGWFYTYFRDKANIWGIGSIQRRWSSICCCSTGIQGTLQV